MEAVLVESVRIGRVEIPLGEKFTVCGLAIVIRPIEVVHDGYRRLDLGLERLSARQGVPSPQSVSNIRIAECLWIEHALYSECSEQWTEVDVSYVTFLCKSSVGIKNYALADMDIFADARRVSPLYDITCQCPI